MQVIFSTYFYWTSLQIKNLPNKRSIQENNVLLSRFQIHD